jgi:hypothetical protein
VRYLVILTLVISYNAISQSSKRDSVFQIRGGIDYYVGLQLNEINQEIVPIYVSHNHLKSGSVNLGLLEVTYQPTKSIRVQLSPGFGSYMNANYSSENKKLRWIYESYVGFKPSKKRNDWVDIGVFSSPYTYEFAKSWEQPLYTRSIAPEYVPYYLLGVRYKRKINERFSLTTFLLNGWQRIEIQRKIPSLGTQLEFSKGKNYVSWTTYQGNEKTETQPDLGYRAFTEISWIYSYEKIKLLSCLYGGMQYRSSKPIFWGQANVAIEYKLLKKLFVNARIEHFLDPSNVQITQVDEPGFNCSGLSLGTQWWLTDQLSVRMETKLLRDNSFSGYFSNGTENKRFLPLGFVGVNLRF